MLMSVYSARTTLFQLSSLSCHHDCVLSSKIVSFYFFLFWLRYSTRPSIILKPFYSRDRFFDERYSRIHRSSVGRVPGIAVTGSTSCVQLSSSYARHSQREWIERTVSSKRLKNAQERKSRKETGLASTIRNESDAVRYVRNHVPVIT